MAEASLRYLLLWYLLVTCHVLEVRPIPYGVLIHQEGEARIQDSSYEIVFVRNHPTVLRPTVLCKGLQPLQKKVARLLETMKDTSPDWFTMYQARMEALDQSPRRPRGLIDVLGEGLKWLAGTATEKVVNLIKSKVSKLVKESNDHKILIEGMIACVKENQGELDVVKNKTNELML